MADTPPRHKVLIADDCPLILDGLKNFVLKGLKSFLVKEANNGPEVITIIDKFIPDLIIMETSLPIINGIETTKLIKKKLGETKILFFSRNKDKETVLQALASGAKGYILKSEPIPVIKQAIISVMGGKSFFSKDIYPIITDKFMISKKQGRGSEKNNLSLNELLVLNLIAKGHTNKLIAERMAVSPRTIETYRNRIRKKLNMDTLADILKYAIKKGLIE